MKTLLAAGFAVLTPLLPQLHADVLISEIRIDNGGFDVEYFELYNPGPSVVNLNGYSLLVIGDGDGGDGSLDEVVTLDGLTLLVGGRALIADAGLTAIEIDTNGDGGNFVTATPTANAPLNFENRDNVTFALVTGYTGDTTADLDSDDNGTLELPVGVTVVDAISLVETSSGGDAFYGSSLGGIDIGPTGGFVPGHVFRNNDDGNWIVGDFGGERPGSTEGAQRLSGDVDLGETLSDTPGAANPSLPTGSLTLSFSVSSVPESSTSDITATVTRLDSGGMPRSDGDQTIDIGNSDASEVTLSAATVVIPDGQSSATFTLNAVDDPLPDGDQVVTITVSMPGAFDGTAQLTVTDDATDEASLVINEVHYVIDDSNGDANGDGSVDTSRISPDQFIEIVNISNTAVDLTDYRLQDNFAIGRDGAIHDFRDGTVLAPGCSLVVFGGNGVVAGHTAAFGEAEVQISSNGGFFLDATGDTVRLLDAQDMEAATVTLPDLSAATGNGSYQLATDGVLTSGYVRHDSVGTGGSLFSPGSKTDGTAFCDLTTALTLTPSVTSISENAGFEAMTVTVSIPSALTYNLGVSLVSDDDSELIPVDFLNPFITAGETSVVIAVDVIDDDIVDGTQSVTLKAVASGYLNSEIAIDVTDDGDLPPAFSSDIVINEIDSDQPGLDTAEFIELYNTSSQPQSLDNLYLVFINGNNDQSYAAIDLTGNTIPANGYFVVGSTDLNPDLELGFSPQNGPDAIALYGGDIRFYTGNTVLAALPNQLLDVVVYGSNDDDDTELLNFFNPTEGQLNDTSDGSIGRISDGSGAFTKTTPTPGAANMVASSGSAFGTWAAANGGAVTTATDDDSDGDGIPALVEYALGLSLSTVDALPTPVASGSSATITFNKGTEAAADSSVSYRIEVREDLTTGDWAPAAGVSNTTSDISATIPDYPSGKGFARIVITASN